VHLKIIIFDQFQPSSLSHIQINLGEDIFETFVISVDIAMSALGFSVLIALSFFS
jgi:hypothetical protein